jgi:uncharacterized membrane protein YgcG
MLARVLVCFVALVILALPAAAREEIRAFASDIALATDGSVDVIETIEVNAEGNEIRRGIYRDIPVVMLDELGNRVRPSLDVLSVTRNGEPEPYRVERMGDFKRIWIGDPDVFLNPGVHRYAIHYTMTRMGRYFSDYDELYWNATGNYWNFPILDAVATVTLPEGAVISDTAAYTGAVGSKEKSVTTKLRADNVAIFRGERLLQPGEGLTVAVAFQKGILVAPAGTIMALYWFLDRQDVIMPTIAALLVLLYFSLAWSSVGRDPAGGTIIPLFHPPKGFSPGLVHFVHHWGWQKSGWTAFTAAAFSLGVRGLVVIDNAAKKLTLTVTGKQPEANLPPGETVLLDYLSKEGSVTIDKDTGKTILGKRNEFTRAVESENREVWFKDNRGYTVLGMALSLAMLGALVWLGYLDFVWFIFAFMGGVFAGLMIGLFHTVWSGSKFRLVFAGIWVAVVGANVFGGLSALATNFVISTAVIATVSIVGLCIAFAVLMRAPTMQGRKIMDQIEGLRLYLETAEKDRMNMRDEPPMTVERFERLLPYAIALGVEKPWSEHFEAELARNAVGEADRSYSPHWYRARSRSFSPGRIAGTVAAAATGMSAAMVAAQPVSSSSSGSGGGGFSGGGGGGGGGGGW